MKKKYMTPEVEILDVEIEGSVLAATVTAEYTEEGTDEDPSAREFDGFVFDDDDFEDDNFDDEVA